MDKKLSAIIIDDEEHARENVRLLLKENPQFHLVHECGDGQSAIAAIKKYRPDLIFLDIQMPEVNGFEVIRAIPENERPYIIFTTAYDQYAIQAFEINALDYLLKPLSDERFSAALKRATQHLNKDENANLQHRLSSMLQKMEEEKSKQSYLKKLSVKHKQRILFVDVKDIYWIEADNQYVKIHLPFDSYLLRQSLNQLEKVLDPEVFYRSHRSAIVNIDQIDHIEPYFKGDFFLFLKNDTKVKLSRNRTEGLKKIMNW